ncbi:MAG: hypothetical protein LBB53_01060 [Prevotellaceae bacterium]|jgi:hypothetical protein|nr:hypothetical protein [Prevotellaceae bacterium]
MNKIKTNTWILLFVAVIVVIIAIAIFKSNSLTKKDAVADTSVEGATKRVDYVDKSGTVKRSDWLDDSGKVVKTSNF